jgi:cytochrome c-type biogenesis protein CcmH
MQRLMRIVLLTLGLCMPAFALQQLEFETPRMEEDYAYLIHTVRCVACVNQPIAESQATVASDLRREIATRIQAGETRESIEQALLERYGDAIFYTPPKTWATLGLWGAPLILLLIGLALIRRVIR